MFERKWKEPPGKSEDWKEIKEDLVIRELAIENPMIGDEVLDKLKKGKKLETRIAQYRYKE